MALVNDHCECGNESYWVLEELPDGVQITCGRCHRAHVSHEPALVQWVAEYEPPSPTLSPDQEA